MKRISFTVVALLSVAAFLTGCKKQEQCAKEDSPAVCKGVQECFKSGTSVEVCREGEKDANRVRTNLPTATGGGSDALNYDSSKADQGASQKDAKQPAKQ
jgi:hypothetical protein